MVKEITISETITLPIDGILDLHSFSPKDLKTLMFNDNYNYRSATTIITGSTS